jgi:hypothetical protein
METAMRRITGTLAALVWLASLNVAAATLPLPETALHNVSPLQVALNVVPETNSCSVGTAAPLPVRDASDALWFASGPTAQLDTDEMHLGTLAPLVNFVAAYDGTMKLYAVGAPVGTALHFTQAGWQPHWPFC